MRAIYQSKVGLAIMDKGNLYFCWSIYFVRSLMYLNPHGFGDPMGAGAKEILQSLSENQGKKMNSVESVKDIPAFLELFKAR